MSKLDNSRISKHLGQVSEYKDQYDPSLLVREPRSNNREHLDIQDENLPFVGFDTWNAYEVSALTNNGLPVAGVAKIVYPCDSKYIVESKSIKLYFNSFNMYRCGATAEAVNNFVTERASKDLSVLLETDVQVSIVSAGSKETAQSVFEVETYQTLEHTIEGEELNGLSFTQYNESADLLEFADITGEYQNYEQRFHSALLKSNCRVTSQPDWGDIYVYMRGSQPVQSASLLKYIVSFRDECHFHEEICETVFKRLKDIFLPVDLCVTCLYARRGGIDINPVRATSVDLISKVLTDPMMLHHKTLKQ
jgi:7-cyano-7-deazaguanine reductase